MNGLRLGLRLLASGGFDTSLRLLLFALIVGVGSVTTTGFLADRIERALTTEGARFLGADLVISSPRPIESWPTHALTTASTLEFASMASTGDAFQLADIKAVDAGYPVRGEVRIAATPDGIASVRTALPPRGTVYVEARLLPLLNARVGDRIELGNADFRIAGVVTEEPGQSGGVFGLAPGMLMRADEVASTGVIQPGSRVRYRYQFAGDATAITEFSTRVKPLLDSSQRVTNARDGAQSLRGAFDKSAHYLRLAGLASLMLALVAIALAAQRHARRRIDEAALLRCLGATSRELIAAHLAQWLAIGATGCGLGIGLGALLQGALASWLLPPGFAALPGWGWSPVIVGAASGLLALLGASLPALVDLARVPPLRVLRRDLPPTRARVWAASAFTAALMLGLVYWHAGSAALASAFIAALAGLAVVLAGIAWGLLKLGALAARLAPGAVKLGLQQLSRHRLDSTLQLGAFSVVLFLLGVLWLARNDMVATWQQQLPSDAPNHFVLNIAPTERNAVSTYLAQHAKFATEAYPMVRGRLVTRNAQPIEATLNPEQRRAGSLRRELNLSHTTQLPDNNQLLAGRWFGDARVAEISVESGMADELGLKLGDVLGFRVGDQQISATVTSLRRVEWASLQPNFFVLFAKGQLTGLPTSHLVGAKIDEAAVPAFVKAFPGVTVISFERLIAQVQGIVEQVSQAVLLMLGFLLAAGLAVVIASLAAGLDARERECVLMRALGAERKTLDRALLLEFVLVGGVAGLLAALGAETAMAALAENVFDLAPRSHPGVWLALPGAGALLAASAGWLATRQVTRVPPMRALASS